MFLIFEFVIFCELGKTELSLVHFTLTNPEWKMPSDAHNFMNGLKRHAQQDLNRARQTGLMNTAMGQSLFSVGNLGGQVSRKKRYEIL